jgi:hypothetical protein
MLRYLRIAVSVVSLVACVLLIALWVRSYWYWDQLYNPITQTRLVIVESASGRAVLVMTSTVPGSPWTWHLSQRLDGKYWGGPLQNVQEENRHTGIGGFGYYVTPWNTTYRVPYWFLVLLFAMLGAAPWIKWSKQFSLRTLLIATTIVAMVLGAVVYATRG